jgi:type IV pilus assembly protein PilC
MATLLGSGVPLIRSLNILEKQQPSRGFRLALIDIRETVENGATFSSSLSKYPLIFEKLYVAMVEAGEVSGNLDNILKKLVTYIEKAEKIKSQVKSALAYPTVVIFVAIAVISGLLIFVVPVFAAQFAETGRALPWLTQQVIDFSNLFVTHWYIIFGSLAGFVFAFRYWKSTTSGRIIFDKNILEAPIIGSVLKKIAIGRFSSTMSSMLGSGVNLLQALSICAASAGNKTIELFVLNVKIALEKGQNFSAPLSDT